MQAFLNKIIDIFRNRPALVLGLVSAALTLAAAFGLNLLPRQSAAILAFVQAALALFANVTTVAKAKYAALKARFDAVAK